MQTGNQELFGAGFLGSKVPWNLINVSCTTYDRRAPQGEVLVFFLQDTFKTAF